MKTNLGEFANSRTRQEDAHEPILSGRGKMTAKTANKDEFICGVLSTLGFVYAAGEETIAEEIVSSSHPYTLLRVARREEDIYLPNLRKTIRFLKQREKMRVKRLQCRFRSHWCAEPTDSAPPD